MNLRSLLFVPGDSERKQARATQSPADALILDLEDSVAPARLPAARELVAALLRAARNREAQQIFVRVSSLGSGELLSDLVAVLGAKPDGIVLPKVTSPRDIVEVDHYVSALERREGLEPASTRLIAIVTETPQALLSFNGDVLAVPRLAALTWGAEDLSTALGAVSKYSEDGSLSFTFQLARSLCLISAAAMGSQAIDGVYPDFRDNQGLIREAVQARRDGFSGKLAIHPDQVEAINAAFTPTEAEVEHARKVIAAFAAAPDAGVTSLDGRMIDRPHLLQAQRLLASASRGVRKS
jgi:citrate lyase subunit beta/citryl-CoA lyase